MRLAAAEIVDGLKNPTEHSDTKEMIGILPKKQVLPALVRKKGTEGWGIRPRYGFAVWKFILWIGII